MRWKAVIFDFFGTLTHPITFEIQREAVRPAADLIGVPVDRLMSTLAATFTDRCLGRWGSFSETMSRLAAEVGVSLSEEQIGELCRVRLASQQRQLMRLRDTAETVIGSLRDSGMGVGVISDCTHELAISWPELPIAALVDVTLFSVEVGEKKPAASLYLSAAKQLGLPPGRCLYVGDGGSNELTGAVNAGMAAVLLDDPIGRAAIVYDRDGWDGPTIGRLVDVLELVRSSGA